MVPTLAISGTAVSAITDAQTVRPFSSIVITDSISGDLVSATVSLSNGAGTLAGAGLSAGVTNAGALTYTLSAATPAALQASLRALTFTPSAHQAAAGTQQTSTFSIVLTDVTNLSAMPTPTLVRTLSTGLNGPQGIATDASGNVFIANWGNSTVSEFNASGALVRTLSIGVSGPTSVATDAAGNVFVANRLNNSVEEFNASGVLVRVLTSGVNGPVHVATDASGNVFVANFDNNTVVEFDPSGAPVRTLSTGINNPNALATDSAGNLFVANFGNSTVEEFNASGVLVRTLSNSVFGPDSLATDGAGALYVGNAGSSLVPVFDASGTLIRTLSIGTSGASALATDTFGNVFISNIGNDVIVEFDAAGALVTAFSSGVTAPWALATDNTGNLFILNNSGSAALEFKMSQLTSITNALTQVVVTQTPVDSIYNVPVAVTQQVAAPITDPTPASVRVVKQGLGTLVFSAANSYTGGSRIEAGLLQVTGSGSLGAASNSLVITGPTAELNLSGAAAQRQDGGVTLANGGTLASASIASSAGIFSTGGVFRAVSTNALVTLQSGVTTAAAGSGNNFYGGFQINGGATLSVGDGASLGGIGGANGNNPAAISMAAGATFALGDGVIEDNLNIALSGDDNITVAAGAATISAVIQNGASPPAPVLIKQGAGTLTLTAANTYAGNTVVSGGVLRVSGSGTLGTAFGSVVIASSATLDLSGTTQTKNGNIALAGGTLTGGTINANAGILSTGGVLSRITTSTAVTLQSGVTTVTAGSSNNFAGGFQIASGATLSVGASALLGGVAGTNGNNPAAISMSAGATLALGDLVNESNFNLVLGGDDRINVATGTATISAVIQNGVSSPAGVLNKGGGGTLVLSAANSFTGGIVLKGGTLKLGAVGAAGSGGIAFGTGANATLAVAFGVTPTNPITGFNSGDKLDFLAVAPVNGEQVALVSAAGGVQTWALKSGAATLATFNLVGAYNPLNFRISSDGAGGTNVGFLSSAAKASVFNGGVTSSLLWFNTQSGLTLDWEMQSGAIRSSKPIAGFAPGSGWSIAGRDDLNGDGTTDILLSYASGGQVTIGTWLIANGQYSQFKALGGFAAGSGWSVVGTGDFSGDGTGDILLSFTSGGAVRLYDWRLANAAIQSTDNLNMGYATNSGWSVLATGDFTGDGVTDVLFQNSQSGLVADWAVNQGTAGVFTSIAGVTPGSGWSFDGVGDFNGDGTSDILWQNGSTMAVWEVLNGALLKSVTITTPAPAGYAFSGIGDYFGDGTSGVLWSNAVTGNTEIWRMSDAQVVQTAFPGGVTPGSGWQILK